jgi:hypothetical protein
MGELAKFTAIFIILTCIVHVLWCVLDIVIRTDQSTDRKEDQ